MASKQEIRPIYSELQGYLAQAPKTEKFTFYGNEWEQYNNTIDELNKLTDKDYNRFKLEPLHGSLGSFVRLETYCQKLGGLIARLHAEYFSDEVAPFAEMPSTIITQSQEQTQSFQIQMLLEVQSKIDEKIAKFDEGSKERKFLEKVKGSLASIRNIAGLIALLLSVAKECGLSIEDLKSLFN